MLYGDLTVNGHRIGWWSAQRTTTRPDGNHTYRWQATLNGIELDGYLEHQFADGAAVLAANVLARYAGINPGTPRR